MSIEPDAPGASPPSWSVPERSVPATAANPWGGAAPPAGAGTVTGSPTGGWGTLGGDRPPAYGAIITRRGIVAIKPLGLGDILDGSFRAIRHNPKVMIGMSLLVILVTTLISVVPLALTVATGLPELTANLESLAADASADEVIDSVADPLAALLGGSLLSGLLGAAGTLILNGILIVSVGQSVVDRRISFGETWRRVRGRLLPLIGQTIVIGLAVAVPYLLALGIGTVLAIYLDPVVGIVVGVVLLAAAAVLAIYLSIVWSLAPAVLVLERSNPLASLGRSRRLLHHAFWRTLGILLLTGLIVSVIVQLITLPLSILAQLPVLLAGSDGGDGALVTLSVVLSYVGGQLITVVVYPFLAAVVALLYIDRRIRREGLDIALTRALAEPT